MTFTSVPLPDASTPFADAADERAHFESEHYKTSEAFRSAVAQKMALSKTGSVTSSPRSGALSIQFGGDRTAVEQRGTVEYTATEADHQAISDRQEIQVALDAMDRKAAAFEADQKAKANDIYNDASFVSPESPRAIALSKTAFASQDEMVQAMSSSRYRNDPRWQAHVEGRVRLMSR